MLEAMTRTRRPNVNWTAYASAYDLMAENNPAYREIVEWCLREAHLWALDPGDMIADVGAGTGNFSIPLADLFPRCKVMHVDGDQGMIARARRKAAAQNVHNITFMTQDIAASQIAPGSLGAVVTVHTLYTLPNPTQVIKAMHTWLRPGGYLFACDLGRLMNVGDWARYLFLESYRRHGLARTLSMFVRGRVVARQNRLITCMQREGSYWLHSLEDYTTVFRCAGFMIEKAFETYRGYSDVIVCRK
jgi:ubiquinone/menaquinone biosynthesis C-methylase UbiE